MSVEKGRPRVHAEGQIEQANEQAEQAGSSVRVVPSPVNGQVAPLSGRWPPGVSGNPAGRPPKPLSTAANRLSDVDAGLIIEALVKEAKAGDVKAAELLFERIEGSVPKNINHSGGVGVVKVIIRRDVGVHG